MGCSESLYGNKIWHLLLLRRPKIKVLLTFLTVMLEILGWL